VRTPQSEKGTQQAVVAIVPDDSGRFSLHSIAAPENIPVCGLDERQSVCAAAAAAVEFGRAETIAIAKPQQIKSFRAERSN
jgi:hypothetical protein